MIDLIVSPDFWVSRIYPEGTIERWLLRDGAAVGQKACLAQLRIEGSLVELLAPVAGKLVIDAEANSIIEPGSIVGHIVPDETGAPEH